jgi:hypothetical protein
VKAVLEHLVAIAHKASRSSPSIRSPPGPPARASTRSRSRSRSSPPSRRARPYGRGP